MKIPKTEPMIRAAKKAYAATEQAKLEALARQFSFWSRRETIARNKLAEIRCQLVDVTKVLAKEVDECRLRVEVLP